MPVYSCLIFSLTPIRICFYCWVQICCLEFNAKKIKWMNMHDLEEGQQPKVCGICVGLRSEQSHHIPTATGGVKTSPILVQRPY